MCYAYDVNPSVSSYLAAPSRLPARSVLLRYGAEVSTGHPHPLTREAEYFEHLGSLVKGSCHEVTEGFNQNYTMLRFTLCLELFRRVCGDKCIDKLVHIAVEYCL